MKREGGGEIFVKSPQYKISQKNLTSGSRVVCSMLTMRLRDTSCDEAFYFPNPKTDEDQIHLLKHIYE